MNNIRDKVLKAIETGHVAMRPRWHFVLRGVLLAVGIALVFLAVIYFASFIVFSLHNTGAWFAPGFGLRGFGPFFLALPWLLILLSLLFIIVLEILVNRYSFAYRKPLLYSVAGVIMFAVAGSAVIARTSFHRGLHERARAHHLPFGEVLYRGYDRRPDNVTAGRISDLSDGKLRIRDFRGGEEFEILIGPGTDYPADLAASDAVVILGNRSTSTIQAVGIRRIMK